MNKIKQKIEFFVTAILYFDRKNGNTYHSCMIERTSDGATLYCSFTYGYGVYKQTALDAMVDAGWLPEEYAGRNSNGTPKYVMYERENGYPISWHVSNGTKKACVALGEG